MIDDPLQYAKRFGSQNLIYSIGLADYLPDRVLKKLIRFCFDLLSQKGKLIFAFKYKERDPFAPLPPDWFCDWKYYPRTEDEFKTIIGRIGINGSQVSFSRERDGYIFFTNINKHSSIKIF